MPTSTSVAACTYLHSINNVRVALGDVRKFGHALRGLFPVALWTAAAAAWVIYSPGDILHTRPLALVLAIGVEFAMLVVRNTWAEALG